VPALVGRTLPDLLLLNDDDLTYSKVRLDPHSTRTALAALPGLADPLSRAVGWQALWDATRDAELPAEAYLDLVLRGLAHESDLTAVNNLLGQAALAVGSYTPLPPGRPRPPAGSRGSGRCCTKPRPARTTSSRWPGPRSVPPPTPSTPTRSRAGCTAARSPRASRSTRTCAGPSSTGWPASVAWTRPPSPRGAGRRLRHRAGARRRSPRGPADCGGQGRGVAARRRRECHPERTAERHLPQLLAAPPGRGAGALRRALPAAGRRHLGQPRVWPPRAWRCARAR
jgi:hypothetical protein